MKEPYEHNGFLYLENPVNGEYIKHDKNKPENLYKYYGMSKYSVEALIKGYLYASHPFDLNDTLDSNFSLLIASKVEERFHDVLYRNLQNKPERNYNEIEDRKAFVHDLYNDFSTKFGVVSLTGDATNDLVWPHYTQEQGFQIMFNTQELEKSLKENLLDGEDYLGVYPINYCDVLKTIDIGYFKNLFPPFFYFTNVKMKCWSYENEWRLVVSRGNMYFPHTKLGLSRGQDFGDIKSRFFYYDKSLAERFVVVKNFFYARSFYVVLELPSIFKVKPKEPKCTNEVNYHKDFLDYIVENFSDKFYLSDTEGLTQDDGNYVIRRVTRRFGVVKNSEGFYVLTRTEMIS